MGEVRQAARDLLCEQTPALDAVASALEEGAVMSAEEVTRFDLAHTGSLADLRWRFVEVPQE